MAEPEVCILHLEGTTAEPLKPFDSTTWTKVTNIHKQRRSMYKNSKFFKIILPDQLDGKYGYHSKCYKNFTALQCTYDTNAESPEKSPTPTPVLRSSVNHPSTSTTGVFEPKCIFCDKIRKKVTRDKSEELPTTLETEMAENSLKEAARLLNDHTLLAKISGQDLIAKELKLHHSCRKNYMSKAKRLKDRAQHSVPTDHEKAIDGIKSYVQQTLVDSEGAEKLQSLFKRYTDALGSKDTSYTSQKLCDTLLKHFSGLLKTCKRTNREGVVVHNHLLEPDDALRRADFDDKSLTDAAYYIRNQILSSETTNLPAPITVEAIKVGQANKPDALTNFIKVLYTGTTKDPKSEQTERLIDSVTDDIMYVVSHGRTKTGKHLSLALAMKSITGSRRVIEILNRFGHCSGYHVAETIETQLATAISARDRATPDGMVNEPQLCTSLAWDNYDEATETLSGKGTLHDTVGICYQNVPTSKPMNEPQSETTYRNLTMEVIRSNLSSRSFKMNATQLEPYRKKPKKSSFAYQTKEVADPPHLLLVKHRDIFWMMNVASSPEVPLWIGWNASLTPDPLPKQQIGYMENINLPPTRLDVVAQTLKQSQRIALECHQDYVVVTYDLAVAKLAMQVQLDDAPLYDNVFICFGAFHVLLAYFASLGHLLDGSGGPDILTESEVLAMGSLNGFLSGKHYNRCKRLHPMLAIAFQILHFKAFLDVNGPLGEALKEKMSNLVTHPSPDFMQEIEAFPEYEDIMNKYMNYTDATLNGDHGSTAKYWITYVQLVAIYHRFNRACRSNDLDLFIHALREMIPIFFAANRPNYSRWMVRYYMNLVNMDESHPGVQEMLNNGALSIRRTEKPFSRSPVDLTLEQTINADAASRQTGIAAFSSSEAARQRWTITRFARSAIVGNLLVKAGLKSVDDVTQGLKPHRVKKDRQDLERLISCIENTMNPFAIPPRDSLHNIVTGREVSDDIKNDLLGCQQIGEKWHHEFVSGCLDDETRFNKPIRRRKVKNFAAAASKSTVRGKDEKLIVLKSTRDLFGRLLYISSQEKVDLPKVLTYPLVEFPMSLSHVDGILTKTDKSQLMTKLESTTLNTTPPPTVDVTLVDAMFHLHILQNIPETYGEIAQKILEELCRNRCKRIDFICDSYTSPSIKDVEHSIRSESEVTYCITGSDQKRPKDWIKALQSPSFKNAFFHFLSLQWRDQSQAGVLNGHIVFLALGEVCYQYSVINGEVRCQDMQDYHCQHDEADTRIMFHLSRAIEEEPSLHVVIRCNDTDILVLLLYHCSRFRQTSKVWMDAGLSGKNTRRYINICQLLKELEPETVDALPGLHALTGSDFTAAFMGKGKVRPFNLMTKSPKHTHTLAELGEEDVVSDELLRGVESFVCALYGYPKEVSVDKVRYLMFQEKYSPIDDRDPLDKIKGLNPSSLPPCHRVLTHKVKRANFVAAMWKRASSPSPIQCSPDGNGWCLQDGKYQLKWYDGDQVPRSLGQVLGTNVLADDNDDDDDNDNDDHLVESDSDDNYDDDQSM